MPRPDLLLFDGDDTLWRSEILYDDARSRAADLVSALGFDRDIWIRRQKVIDLENFKTMGLSSSRFPSSCVMAYEEVAGEAISLEVSKKVQLAAETVFSAVAENFPEAKSTIEWLAERVALALLTKGDQQVQEKRIEDSGLGPLFSEVYIVEKKTEGTFRDISSAFASKAPWSIGNSYPSDIVPAERAGYFGVWIDAPVWAHERREVAGISSEVARLDSIGQLPRYFLTFGGS